MHVIERLQNSTTRDLIMTRFLRPHRLSPLRPLSFSFYLFRRVYLWSVYRQCTSQRKVEFKVNVISVDFVDCLSIVMMHNNIKLSLINNYRSCNCCESYTNMPPGTDCPYPIRIWAFFEMIRAYHAVVRI